MHTFGLKRITSVKGRIKFYQLMIDDNLVLDDYENRLERKYKKGLEMIYAYMNLHSNGENLPGTKYHLLQRPKNDPYPDFEFKHGDLRLYGVKTIEGKIIFLGGYKNSQKKNIKKLRSLKNQYFANPKLR